MLVSFRHWYALKNLVLLGGLFLFAVGILIFGLMQGSFSVPASEVGRALFAPENVSTDARYIVQDIRLPRVIMALLCGAMLGMAGAAMQSIARNGLADPGLIGVKEGCSVAVLWLHLSSFQCWECSGVQWLVLLVACWWL